MNLPSLFKIRTKRSHLESVNQELERVRATILKQVDDFSENVRPYIERVSQSQGKLLRPGLVLLTAAATGGIKEEHITFAALLEMVHLASLVHDDVLDLADTRRNVETANALWGNSLAVLLGDALLSQAMIMGVEIGNKTFIKHLAFSVRELCQGEIEQSSRLWDAVMTRADYFELIRKKTATLFSMATSGAALLQEMNAEQVAQMNQLGEELGIAYQIYDDCLDLSGSEETAGKTLGTDTVKGKLTLPIFLLMESSDEEIAQQVRETIHAKKALDFDKIRHTQAFADALQGSVNEGLARNAKARELLMSLPPSTARKAFAKLIDHLDELIADCHKF